MVYFVQATTLRYIKIGYTRNFESLKTRLTMLQTGCPDKLNLIGIINNVDAAFEYSLHSMFKDSNIRGEWFEPTESLLIFIKDNSIDPKICIEQRNKKIQQFYAVDTREEMLAKARAGNEKFIGLDHLEYLKARMLQ